MAKILSIFEHKGGVGKTTTAASIGGILASRFGKRVLLVDIDAQKNLTQTFIDDKSYESGVFELFSILETRKLPASLPVVHVRENLDIIPATDNVCTLDKTYGSFPGWEYPLKKSLSTVRDRYDWIILDSPAQIGVATTNALTAADYVLIPLICDGYSMTGIKQTLDLIEGVQFVTNPDLKVIGYLRNMFQGRRVADSVVDAQLRRDLGDAVFGTSIRECQALKQAALSRMDILSYDDKSNAAADYIAFTGELLKRVGE